MRITATDQGSVAIYFSKMESIRSKQYIELKASFAVHRINQGLTLKFSSTRSRLRRAACVHVIAIILAVFINRYFDRSLPGKAV